jgi:hypothetical protein
MKILMTEENQQISIQELPQASDTPQLLERVFTDQFGRSYRMVFMVAVVDGELKGKLVSVHPISAAECLKLKGTCASSGTIFLPADISKSEIITEYIPTPAAVASPYISLEYLMTSQPTRAPSFYN